MIHIHTLGFPRIGANRELKLALESYWLGKTSRLALEATGAELRQRHWQDQSMLDLVPVGDFSYYDHVLDMSFTLGNLPERIRGVPGTVLDNSFRIARGCSAQHADIESRCKGITAGEMTKWFDTNYHYIVPEFSSSSQFRLDASRLLDQLAEANSLGVKAKPVIIGPVTYLALGKARDGSDRLELLARLLPVYTELLATFSSHGVEWVQIDEPLLVTELTPEWQKAFQIAYKQLSGCEIKLLLTTYFGPLAENLEMVASLPVEGLHIDVSHDHDDVERLIQALPKQVILSLGVINGRNVWKSDLHAMLDWLEPLAARMCERLWLAPSCSLLHVPVDLDREQALNGEIKSWLAFAKQKIGELVLLASALHSGRDTVRTELTANQAATSARRESPRTNSPAVKTAMAGITPSMSRRQSPYAERAAKQAPLLKLPVLPTTTIGSFPQTDDIRRARKLYKAGRLDQTAYRDAMRAEIARCVREQEKLDLDVLVHGEAERNDMVEFFGAQLDGYAISQFGWVQSYGSRCVKPPILYGDVRRSQPMSVEWIAYAQSLTNKPVKGILTGPVTMLNWSFVRDDQPRSLSCKQLALAIREEVLDLEKAGVRVIQIDEAALREGLPLRQSQWPDYLHWAVETYRLAANGVADQTQIHTHMCYAEFNDIIAAIAAMDADVITIETSRSNMELLDTFDVFKYPNGIGPGVYDIHSPNIPRKEHIVELILKATERIPAERLWVNPDCGLKTRQWREVIPALTNMVAAAHTLRNKLTSSIRHVPY